MVCPRCARATTCRDCCSMQPDARASRSKTATCWSSRRKWSRRPRADRRPARRRAVGAGSGVRGAVGEGRAGGRGGAPGGGPRRPHGPRRADHRNASRVRLRQLGRGRLERRHGQPGPRRPAAGGPGRLRRPHPGRRARTLRSGYRGHHLRHVGRAWREGAGNVAIGCAGIAPLWDSGGCATATARAAATTIAVADEIAAAAELVTNKLTRVPAAIVRGYPYAPSEEGVGPLIRTRDKDLFR